METRILTLFDDDFFPPEPPKEKPKKEKAPKPASNKTDEPDETASKDIIADALNEFREKELKESGVNEPITSSEADPQNNISATEAMPAATDTEASTETVLEEVYNDTILEETVMADAIHFEEPPEPVFVETEAEPVIYSDALAEDAASEEDIILSMEDENDIVEETENEVSSAEDTEAIIEELNVAAQEDTINENDAEHAETQLEEEIETTNEIVEDVVTENQEETTEEESTEIITPPASREDKELNQQILSELIQLDYTALMQKEYSFDLNNATVINKELPKPKPQSEKVVAVEDEQEEEEVFEDVTPLPEWKLDKKYYTIGEVATLFEVNTSHIRFWTNEFKLRPRTTRKGDRLYSPKDIAELRLIHHLVKVKKHTIKGAREKLKAEKTDVNNKLDLKESLVQLKDTLMKIREQL